MIRQAKAFSVLTSWTPTLAPEKGDLWSFGEIANSGDFYTNKAGKLFKISAIETQSKEEEVTISATEYISNVYIDSDTFIDYTPTAYTDIVSPLYQFLLLLCLILTLSLVEDLTARLVSMAFLILETSLSGYNQDLRTEYFISRPDGATLVNNVTPSSAFL